MTAAEQLLQARELGHELSVVQRGPWPEHGDPHPKFYVACTCGWSSKGAARSRKGANFYLVRHLGFVLAESA